MITKENYEDKTWVKVMNMLEPLFEKIQSYKEIIIEYNQFNKQKVIIKQKTREYGIDIPDNIDETVLYDIKEALLAEIHYQIYLAIKQIFTDTNLLIILPDGATYSTSREIIKKCNVETYISQSLTKEFNTFITDIVCNEKIEDVIDYLEYRYTEEAKSIINSLTAQLDKLFKQQYNNVKIISSPTGIKDIQYTIKT